MDLSQLYGSFAKLLNYYRGAYPIAIESGLTCIAYVISDDIITQNLTVKLEKMGASFNVKTSVFRDSAEAEKWIKSAI